MNINLIYVKKPKQQMKKKCPLCEYRSSLKKKLISHFEVNHDIQIIRSYTNFAKIEEFKEYLKTIEKNTKSRFVKKISTTNILKFDCNRSGEYVPIKNRNRALEMNGSNKINAFCPASLTVRINKNGTYQCEFLENHIGHTNDMGHFFLSEEDRNNFAVKIASKIPFDAILDNVRDAVEGDYVDRLHLLTKRDLYNIEKSFNLNSVRHCNDAVSVDSLVNEMSKEENNCVLFYKPQDSLSKDYSQLKKEDFILIIMNSVQCHLLKKYGSDCICLDGTHGTNGYNFELITLLVIDDMRQLFPCAFMITDY
uniref:Uncharacterized protein LOC114346518 isoform X1 n=1 Tax=Diabrotica virgifera virgifera TaxID=50390 RepID=A0A6P7HB34_DIAVI